MLTTDGDESKTPRVPVNASDNVAHVLVGVNANVRVSVYVSEAIGVFDDERSDAVVPVDVTEWALSRVVGTLHVCTC